MLLLAVLALHFVQAPHSVMRESPSDDAIVSSELFFSEEVIRLDDKDEWVLVQNRIDSYKGWIKKATLYTRDSQYPTGRVAKIQQLRAHIYCEEDTTRGPILTLPFEAKVVVIKECCPRWLQIALPDASQAYIQRGDVTFDSALLSKEQMCHFSRRFLGLPYTWGGRSSYLGYDCSGFVQMLYRQMGVFLPRDSSDQVNWDGFKPITTSELKPGDLIFWGYSADKIRHVGMYLGDGEFIHTSSREIKPYLRISKLTDTEWNGNGLYPYFTARTMSKS